MQALDYDIISVICDSIEERHSLLCLALTSKTFLEPALDNLWREITTFYPLLCVLPEAGEFNGDKTLIEPITERSWKRLFYYTCRVRSLKGDLCPVVPTVYRTFSVLEKPLFPYIKSISLGNELFCLRTIQESFLSNTLQSVSLISSLDADILNYRYDLADSDDFGPAVSFIAEKVPHLRELVMIKGKCKELPLLLKKLQNLQSLRLYLYSRDFMGSSLLQTVHSLPNLDELGISTIDYRLSPGVALAHLEIPTMRTTPGFLHLTKLDIATSALGLSELLDNMPENQLSLLVFRVSIPPSWIPTADQHCESFGDIPTVFSKFVVKQRVSLETLRVGDRFYSPANVLDLEEFYREDWRSAMRIILDGLSGLTSFRYDLPLRLTDDLVEVMAKSWPNIVELELNVHNSDPVSVESLSHFARHCSFLDRLCVPLKVDDISLDSLERVENFCRPLVLGIAQVEESRTRKIKDTFERVLPWVELEIIPDMKPGSAYFELLVG
ncbi:hypothetical protein K435DRAFT_835948 [Dendrothele bispora CBS 962.96]|uniref:F-box domain-containing protein n=1 Tax=Dendrothele bispora (strain CBS 962.96) TaxID=1314807 RepID=A0A4S8MKL5_DENBC|nr:hypothetical protein K435DRAFT_835948 [Dendrothele bispora CBS 962.96]